MVHLKDSMIMYSTYKAEVIEKIVRTLNKLHNKITWNKILFSAKLKNWYLLYLTEGVTHSSI